jgi:hypothetical protein
MRLILGRAAQPGKEVQMYQNAYILLTMLQGYAPTGKEQQMCSDLYNELARDLHDDAKVTSALAGHLKDGLDHGNWFWLTSR